MKRIVALFLLIIMAASAMLPLSAPVLAAEASDGEYVLDEIIIGFYPKTMFPGSEKQYEDEVARVLKDGLTAVSDNVYVVKSEDFSKNPNATLNRFKNSQFIEYVEPNYIMKEAVSPNDPEYKSISAVLKVLNFVVLTTPVIAVLLVRELIQLLTDAEKLSVATSAKFALPIVMFLLAKEFLVCSGAG